MNLVIAILLVVLLSTLVVLVIGKVGEAFIDTQEHTEK